MLKVIIERLEELLQGPFKRILFHHVWSESDYVRVPNYGEVFENFYNLGIDKPKENTTRQQENKARRHEANESRQLDKATRQHGNKERMWQDSKAAKRDKPRVNCDRDK